MLNTDPPTPALEFRVFHTAVGIEMAERVRLEPTPDGRLPTAQELTDLVAEYLGLEEAEEVAPGDVPRRDRETTWLLRNVTKGEFVTGDQPAVEQGDALEIMTRSVAGRAARGAGVSK